MLDWQRIVLNIRGAGMSATALAKRIGCDITHVQRLARAEVREPKFSVALAILDVHGDLCKSAHTLASLKMPVPLELFRGRR